MKTFVMAANLPKQSGSFIPAGSKDRISYRISHVCGVTEIKGASNSVSVMSNDIVIFNNGTVTKVARPRA